MFPEFRDLITNLKNKDAYLTCKQALIRIQPRPNCMLKGHWLEHN